MNMQAHLFSVRPINIEALDSNTELLQTGHWGRLKSMHGWKPFAFRIERDGEESRLLVLVRRLAPFLSIGYVPLGPSFREPVEKKESFIESLGAGLQNELPGELLFLRFDLPWHTRGPGIFPLRLRKRYRLKKAPADIQPPSTVLLDLQKSEDELLGLMKHKTRYNIRLALKKGVAVYEGEDRDLRTWYDLYVETARRDRIAIHSYEYYRSVLKIGKTGGTGDAQVKLLLAAAGETIIAGIIIAINRKKCWYLYGASSNAMRNLMPNHALQWEAIRLARRLGCEEYDFFGIPEREDPANPMYGLYRFKTGFGGEIENRYGCYDVPYKPVLYRIYSVAEKLRMFYYKRIKKKM